MIPVRPGHGGCCRPGSMIARIATGALLGVEAFRVDVEVAHNQGLPATVLIGLPDSAVREARMRVESALKVLGVELPSKRITISLAPSSLRKTGAAYDLPIAVGVLDAFELIPRGATDGLAFVGELTLDGKLRGVRGVLALARLARDQGLKGIVVPDANAAEAAVVPDLPVYGAANLAALVAHLREEVPLPATPPTRFEDLPVDSGLDLLDVRGQSLAKDALEAAAAGGHHLLFIGPPGAGKTMLARRLPDLLPPLTPDEAVEVTQIYSAAGLLGDRALVRHRPFRAPHHTASQVALVGGGGHTVRVGELTLAHRGVLFLDEAAEIPRPSLDALRQPLERGEVWISRADLRVCLPARAQLVVALNPCPCGWRWADAPRPCICPPSAPERYLSRLSGPLLDRIDLHVAVQPLAPDTLTGPPSGRSSAEVRERVARARALQADRLAGRPGPSLNAWMRPADLKRFVALDDEDRSYLHEQANVMRLTARGIDRLLRVARTFADLDGSERVARRHLHQATTFRSAIDDLRREHLPLPQPGRVFRPKGAPTWA